MATIVPVSAKATAPVAAAAPAVVVDIEATVKAEVAKVLAEAKAEVKTEEAKILAFIQTYWPHATWAAVGYAAAAFGVVAKILKFI